MIAQDFNMTRFMNSVEYERLKEANRREINSHRMVIDYACFKKTDEERARLYGEKKEWKRLHKN